MRLGIRMAALAVFVVALGLWFFGGPNLGWTRTSVPVKTVDEVTGIEGVSYQRRFVPGVDFVGASAALAGLLAGISFFFKDPRGAGSVSPPPPRP